MAKQPSLILFNMLAPSGIATIECVPSERLPSTFFFYRWHVTNEDFPRFDTNKDWFDLKVAKGVYRDRAMTYGGQLNARNRAFKVCHISSSKKTYTRRLSGARHAEIDGTLNSSYTDTADGTCRA